MEEDESPMKQPYALLRAARWVFLVLAYVVGATYLVFLGIVPLVGGGEPVPIVEGGPDIPARVFGILNILISAPLAFLALYLPSGIIHLLLGLRERVK